MTKDQARRAIRAHERAGMRAKTDRKRQQHEKAIAHYRLTFDIPTPVSFGRDNPRMAEAQRAMHDHIKGVTPKAE